jgi:hypothetical protein
MQKTAAPLQATENNTQKNATHLQEKKNKNRGSLQAK